MCLYTGWRAACCLLALLCGSTACSPSTSGSQQYELAVELTFTREDGSNVAMSKARLAVWRGPWESDVRTDAIHIFARGPDPLNSRAGWCSAQTDGGGAVSFEALDCSEGGRLELRIDAVQEANLGVASGSPFAVRSRRPFLTELAPPLKAPASLT